MAGEWSASTLSATYKEVYADDMANLVKLNKRYLAYNNISFDQTHKPGGDYRKPVLLSRDGVFNYASGRCGVITYRTPNAPTVQEATLRPSNLFGRSLIDSETAARGASSKYAFKSSVGLLMESLFDSTVDRVENDLWNGGLGIGTIEKITGEAAVSPGSGALAANQIQISYDTWSVASWAGHEGTELMVFDKLDNAGGHSGTHRNTGYPKITSVDVNTRIITLDTIPAAAVDGDVVVYSTQAGNAAAGTTGDVQTMLGLHYLTGLTSGNALNISTGYSLWKSAQQAVGGRISLNTIADGIAQGYSKGLSEDVSAVYAPKSWVHLATDWSALKRGDLGSAKGFALGTNDLEIVLLGITAKIQCSPFCRHGRGVMLPWSTCSRIGAQEVTDKAPGLDQDYIIKVSGGNSYEFQTYSNQALFAMLGKCVNFTGITD